MFSTKLVSATAVAIAVIVLGLTSFASPASAFWPFSKKVAKHVVVKVNVPLDTVYVDQFGHRLPNPTTPAARVDHGSITSDPRDAQTFTTSQGTTLHEGGVAIGGSVARDLNNGHTAVGITAGIGSYTATVRSDGTASYSQNPNTNGYSGYGMAPPAFALPNTGTRFTPTAYSSWPPQLLAPIYVYTNQAERVGVTFKDENGYTFRVVTPGCSLRDGNASWAFVPPGKYGFMIDGSGWDSNTRLVDPRNNGGDRTPTGLVVGWSFCISGGGCTEVPYGSR